MPQTYEQIGTTYHATRRQDRHIAQAIHSALGTAESVLNVGAGTGSYEPDDRDVLAVEPSATMIQQRPRHSAFAIQARAEALPLPSKCVDVAMAVNTLHHWIDVRTGVREMRRVARQRVVIFHRNAAEGQPLWVTERYFPALLDDRRMARIRSVVAEELHNVQSIPVPVPASCEDGLFSAFWARPEAYLDASVRRNISNFALADPAVVSQGLERLQADLASGAWDREYGRLRRLNALDLGHRLLVADVH